MVFPDGPAAWKIEGARVRSVVTLALALAFAACAAPDTQPDAAPPADTAVTPAPPAGDTGAASGQPPATVRVGERSVGDVRLGMSAAELRARPSARDTSWQAEGMEERGVIVPVGSGVVTALIARDAVARITVRDRAITTPEGLGVGARMADLRAAYGTPCAGVGENGRTAVWFARRPGVSFGLDHRPGARAADIPDDPSLVPDDAAVEALWVHGESVACRPPA